MQSNGYSLSKLQSRDATSDSVTSDQRDSASLTRENPNPLGKSRNSPSSSGEFSPKRRDSPASLESLSKVRGSLLKRRDSPSKLLDSQYKRIDSLNKLIDSHSKRRDSPIFDGDSLLKRKDSQLKLGDSAPKRRNSQSKLAASRNAVHPVADPLGQRSQTWTSDLVSQLSGNSSDKNTCGPVSHTAGTRADGATSAAIASLLWFLCFLVCFRFNLS